MQTLEGTIKQSAFLNYCQQNFPIDEQTDFADKDNFTQGIQISQFPKSDWIFELVYTAKNRIKTFSVVNKSLYFTYKSQIVQTCGRCTLLSSSFCDSSLCKPFVKVVEVGEVALMSMSPLLSDR